MIRGFASMGLIKHQNLLSSRSHGSVTLATPQEGHSVCPLGRRSPGSFPGPRQRDITKGRQQIQVHRNVSRPQSGTRCTAIQTPDFAAVLLAEIATYLLVARKATGAPEFYFLESYTRMSHYNLSWRNRCLLVVKSEKDEMSYFRSLNAWTATPRRSTRLLGLGQRVCLSDAAETKEEAMAALLKSKVEASKAIVQDISGGCGSMYKIEVESPLFHGQGLVAQHRLVKDALKTEIADMHGLTLHTRPPA